LTKVLTHEKQNLVNENIIYLLVGSPTNLKERLKTFFEEKFIQKDIIFTFVVGTSVAHLGEEGTASIIDYLYQQKGEIYNLSRSETFSLGTSFADLKLLLEVIQPRLTITLQNSYKQKKYLIYLKNDFLTCPNQSYLNFSNQKIYSLPAPKENQEFENFLLAQRQNLFQNGFLVVLITVKREKKSLKIKGLQLEAVALAPKIDLKKLEIKIKQ
jgi:mRNA degradation ribonuclease J1/J2